MPKNAQYSDLAVNTEAEALGALLNGGLLRIYDGTQPINADTAITNQTLLAELMFSSPAFKPAIAGVITANEIMPDEDAKATTKTGASWYRASTKDGATIMDGSVGTEKANCIIGSTMIQIHAKVSVESFVHTMAKGAKT